MRFILKKCIFRIQVLTHYELFKYLLLINHVLIIINSYIRLLCLLGFNSKLIVHAEVEM